MSGKVPAALRHGLGEEATFGMLELLDETGKRWGDQVLNTAMERFERRLSEETSKLRVEMHEGFAAVRREMADLRVDLLRWSFVFWIGQVTVMAALLSFMLRGIGK